LETGLELALQHKKQGDLVHYFFLGQSISFCDFLKKRKKIISYEISPEKNGSSLLQNSKIKFFINPKINNFYLSSPNKIKSLEQIKSLNYKNFKIGISCLSSLYSRLRTTSVDIKNNKTLIISIINSGISVYNYCCNIFSQKKFDLVYTFNGRFANTRAVLDAATKYGIKVLFHERGADKNHYEVFDFPPHHLFKIQSNIIKTWKKRSPNRITKAKSFFINQRRGAEVGWLSYRKHQIQGRLPKFIKSKRIVSFFSTSDDEFAAIGDLVDWKKWRNQKYALSSLLRVIQRNPNLHLVLRLHPHLCMKAKHELMDWQALKLPPNATMILPDEPTDSYALMERSYAVVSVGSTVGIESVFWGTPSILLGPSMYDRLGAVYTPKDERELEILLTKKILKALPQRALPFGYYQSTFGRKYQFYKAETLFSGKFLGVNLQEISRSGTIKKMTFNVFKNIMGIRH